jgi:hypothetical protein
MDHHHQKPQRQGQLATSVMPSPVPSPLHKQSSSPQKSSASPLGAVEEFAIGFLSGIAGAVLSCCHLSGWSFLLCVVLTPWLALELVESYLLFYLAQSSSHHKTATYQRIVARKRLARQLFGQGVIMGSAGLHITAFSPAMLWAQQGHSLVFYATLWLGWMILCNLADQAPLDDQLATPVKRRHATRRTISASSSRRSRGSAEGKVLRRTQSLSSSSSSLNSGSRRNSQRCCVSVELP